MTQDLMFLAVLAELVRMFALIGGLVTGAVIIGSLGALAFVKCRGRSAP
jgi:hypothetical protein